MTVRAWWLWLKTWLYAHVGIWFDPDHDWRSVDKIEHAFFGFATCLVFLLVGDGWLAFRLTLLCGVVYELGQTDVAHSQHLLGKPGFGFGLLDLFYDCFGAAVLLLFRFTLRLL